MSSARPFIALDLDGTLIDARRRQVAVAAAIIATLGLPPLDNDTFWQLKRDGLNTRLALQHLGYPRAAADEVATQWAASIETPHWLSLDAWLPEAQKALAWLRDAGAQVHVLTARTHRNLVELQCESLGLRARIDALHVVDPTRAADAKAPLLAGALAFIGDTESDARAAQLAAVPFIGVTTGQRSRTFLAAHGVEVLHDDLFAAVSSLALPGAPNADATQQTPDAACRPDHPDKGTQ